MQQELMNIMNTIRLFNKYMLRGEGVNVILNMCFVDTWTEICSW